MTSLLYGVRPHDPAVFLTVPLLLFAIAVLASYFPARRATEVDPISAFREDDHADPRALTCAFGARNVRSAIAVGRRAA